MSKEKKIPEKYINKIIENSPNAVLLSETYINEHTMLDVYCKKHKIKYRKKLKNLLRNNGCPECTREKMSFTTEEFKKKVYLKNPHIEVLGKYTKQGCKILCKCLIHNVEFYAVSQSLLQGKGGCPVCNKERPQRRISSDDIKKSFHKLNPTLLIIDDDVKINSWVNVYCTVCGQYFKKRLSHSYVANKKCVCSVCLNKTIVKGFNDVATVRPDLIKYFKNYEDIYKYGAGMTKKLTFICPDCGYEKELKIEVLARQGFSCPCCGDGISYPNKFVRSFIRQLNVPNTNFEYSPKWAKGYFYDCYFEHNDCKYIIEVDGEQHFKESSDFKMTLKEIKERDMTKSNIAKENNCILIRIDAQKSKKDYICSQIKNSLLSELFDLKNIDWEKCDIDATSNLAKEVCIYAEKTMPDNYKDICKNFNICSDTARAYLKQGIKYGWCSKQVIEKITVPKRVNVYNKNNSLLYTFDGIQKCSNEMSKLCNEKYSIHGISDNCHEIREYYKDYIFKFTYKEVI